MILSGAKDVAELDGPFDGQVVLQLLLMSFNDVDVTIGSLPVNVSSGLTK